MDELKAISFPGRRVIVNDGVIESSCGSNNGNGPVFQTVDLVEAAGLIFGRHQEEVGSGFDLVGQSVIVGNADPGLSRVFPTDPGKEIMVFLFSRAQKDEPDIEAEEILEDLSQQIEILFDPPDERSPPGREHSQETKEDQVPSEGPFCMPSFRRGPRGYKGLTR